MNHHTPSVAYLGILGSFSYAAARALYGEHTTYRGCPTFSDIFEAVSSGSTTYGVIPLENSLAGSIYENYDLLYEYRLRIIAEYYLPVTHYLLMKKSPASSRERVDTVHTVYSHPKALEQCSRFLREHPQMQSVASADTATAAQRVAQSDDATVAAIGSAALAELYDLTIVAEHIEDDTRNYTRFVSIATDDTAEPYADAPLKLSLAVTIAHTPGSLVHFLTRLYEDHHVNMTKIESRPLPHKPFEYIFYIDGLTRPLTARALDEMVTSISAAATKVRVLGMYPVASLPE